MDREGTGARAGGSPDGGRLGWGRIFYYLLFVLLGAFALTLVFGFFYDLLAGYRRTPLALAALSRLSFPALLAAAFAALAHRTPRRPLAHVLVLALFVWLASAVMPGFSASFLGWLAGGALVALLALVGFAAGAGLRRRRAPTGPGESPPG